MILVAVHQLSLYLNFSNALWVWPIYDLDHGALLLPRPEVKLFIFAINVEADFSGSNINLSSRSVQEGSPKDEGRFLYCFHVKHYEVDRDEVSLNFHRDIFSDPCRIADH